MYSLLLSQVEPGGSVAAPPSAGRCGAPGGHRVPGERRGREPGASRRIHRNQCGHGGMGGEGHGWMEDGWMGWMGWDGWDEWMDAPLPHREAGPRSARQLQRPAFPRTARGRLQPAPLRPVRPQPAAEPSRGTSRRGRARGAPTPGTEREDVSAPRSRCGSSGRAGAPRCAPVLPGPGPGPGSARRGPAPGSGSA